MGAKVEYIIAHAHSVTELEQKVRKYLNEGWQLQGGVAVARVEMPDGRPEDVGFGKTGYTYVQAMVRPITGEFLYA